MDEMEEPFSAYVKRLIHEDVRKKNPFNKGFSLLLEGGDAPLEIKEEKENIPSG